MQLHRPLSALTTGKTQNLLSSPPIYASLVNIVYACDATWCFPLGKGSRELSCHFPNPCSLQRAEQQDQEVKPGLTQPVFFPAGMSRTPWHTIQSLAKGWGCWSNHLLLLAFSAAGKSYRRGKNSQSSSLRLGKWITLCWFFQMCSPVQNKPKQLQKPCLADPTAAWPGHEQATGAAAGTGWMHKHTENTNMVHKDKTTTIKKSTLCLLFVMYTSTFPHITFRVIRITSSPICDLQLPHTNSKQFLHREVVLLTFHCLAQLGGLKLKGLKLKLHPDAMLESSAVLASASSRYGFSADHLQTGSNPTAAAH